MESLACHLVVEVHLYSLRCNLEYNARDHAAHAVHHRNCVARYEEVFSYLTVNLECRLWKVDDSVRIDLTVCVSRCKSHVEPASRLHTLDMFLKLRKKASCSMNIVKWLLYCLVDYHSFHFELICELYYCVLSDFHIFFCFNCHCSDVSTSLDMTWAKQRMKPLRKRA